MRSLKGVKQLLLDRQLKINVIELGDEVLVSADVQALRWCYDINNELNIDNVKIVYAFVEVPEVGKVEVVGCKVVDELKVINIKYKVINAEAAIHTYHRVIKHLSEFCR